MHDQAMEKMLKKLDMTQSDFQVSILYQLLYTIQS